MSSYDLFNEVIKYHSLKYVASNLQLNVNTVKRWVELAKVPDHYKGDLSRLLGRKYVGNDEREKDQFYTKPSVANLCVKRFREVAKTLGVNLNKYTYIEPSAGCGWFYDLLPKTRRLGIDIDPRHDGLIEADYLSWRPNTEDNYIVIGNPPFGLRGHLALQFINHSYQFADMVAFILPPLFNSDGKGSPAKRIYGYTLAHTENLPANSFTYPDGRNVNVSAIFQVYTRINVDKVNIPKKKTCKKYIRVYSLSDGGSPSSTRNKKMLDKCDIYLPSTCFTGMQIYNSFEDLPHRRGYGVVIYKSKREIKKILNDVSWEEVAFRSTNGALNLRTSLIEQVLIDEGYHD